MIRANEESLIKSKRLKSAWKHKRENIKDRKLTAKAPLWLKLSKTKDEFEPREERAKTVKKIFDLSIDEGMGSYSITRYLNENSDQYPTFSNKSQFKKSRMQKRRPDWYLSYVRKILTNPSVYGSFQPHVMVDGKRVADGNAIEDYYPPIIPKERFFLAQSKLKQRRTSGAGRKGPTFANIFTTLAECGSCGSSVIFLNKGKPPKGGKYLKCRNSELKSNCSAPLWNYEQFENSFFQFISEIEWDEVFNQGNKQSQLKKSQEEFEILDYLISEKNEELETLTNRLSDSRASEAVLDHIYRAMNKIQVELDADKGKHEGIRVFLAELDNQNQSQEDFVKEFKKITKSNLGEDEKKALRRKAHSQIKNIVDRIIIDNYMGRFNTWEFKKFVSDKLLGELEKKGIKSDEQLENLFDTDYGKRILSDSLRSFRVIFKNGTVKTVLPSVDTAYMSVSNRLVTFFKNIEKRKQEQERRSRKNTLCSKSDITELLIPQSRGAEDTFVVKVEGKNLFLAPAEIHVGRIDIAGYTFSVEFFFSILNDHKDLQYGSPKNWGWGCNYHCGDFNLDLGVGYFIENGDQLQGHVYSKDRSESFFKNTRDFQIQQSYDQTGSPSNFPFGEEIFFAAPLMHISLQSLRGHEWPSESESGTAKASRANTYFKICESIEAKFYPQPTLTHAGVYGGGVDCSRWKDIDLTSDRGVFFEFFYRPMEEIQKSYLSTAEESGWSSKKSSDEGLDKL